MAFVIDNKGNLFECENKDALHIMAVLIKKYMENPSGTPVLTVEELENVDAEILLPPIGEHSVNNAVEKYDMVVENNHIILKNYQLKEFDDPENFNWSYPQYKVWIKENPDLKFRKLKKKRINEDQNSYIIGGGKRLDSYITSLRMGDLPFRPVYLSVFQVPISLVSLKPEIFGEDEFTLIFVPESDMNDPMSSDDMCEVYAELYKDHEMEFNFNINDFVFVDRVKIENIKIEGEDDYDELDTLTFKIITVVSDMCEIYEDEYEDFVSDIW